MKLKRPNLKLTRPNAKVAKPQVPPFFEDLYRDLRDRRLLPLIALLVVAILAVPILLGEDSEGPTEAADESAVATLKEAFANTSAFTVVESKPGLRDYRGRLRSREPTDPFEQRYTTPVLKGTELNEPKSESPTKAEAGGGEEASSTSPTKVESGGGSAPSQPPTSDGDGDRGGGGKGQSPTLYSFAIDVRIVHSSGSGAGKQTSVPDVRRRVLPATSLPGNKTEVVNYVGVNPKNRRPLFVVSTDVTGAFGEGRCVSGTETCQLIELTPGFAQTFIYGDDGDRYKINVLSVEPVPIGRS